MRERFGFSNEQRTRLAWFTYQALAWFYTLGIIISSCIGLLYFKQKYIDIYKYLPFAEYSIKFIFLIACIGAIAKRSWAAHWVSVTGVWCLAMYWSAVPGTTSAAIEQVLYGPVEVIGGGPDPWSMIFPPYVYLLAKPIGLTLLLALIITARIVSKQQGAGEMRQSSSTESVRLLYIGILIIFFGLTLKWVDVKIEQQIYAMTIGSYFVVAGAVLILVWHLLARDLFMTASPSSVSAVLLIFKLAYASSILTFILWLPAIALAAVNLLRRNLNRKLQLAILGLPVVFMLIALFPSVVEVPGYMRFWVYHKITSQRPADFPEYLQAPSGATNVRYRGGHSPYLSFTAQDPYPATAILNFITKHLEEAGWNKLDYDLMNPQAKSSHLIGWHNPWARLLAPGLENVKKVSDSRRYLWKAYWINDKDEALSVMFIYDAPMDQKEELNTLHCNLSQYSSKGWMLEYVRHYKRIHPINDK